jgi:multidrug resistance efflux pump
MQQFTWEPEAGEDTQQELDMQESAAEALEPPVDEPVDELVDELVDEPAAEPAAESGDLALSVDEFSALEERILRAVNLVKRERQDRAAAEERANQAEEQLRQQTPLAEHLQQEVDLLRTERNQVHQRVERLLAQLDALEL